MAEGKIILHIEDNADNRRLVRRILLSYGFQVMEAENAQKARELLQNLQPDLILMDINMPDVDGYTLTTEIKSTPNLRSIPVVAITANVMKGDRERTLGAGCDGYIEKPIDIENFIEQVSHFMT
jgi:two-component system cell cycle response regulator DivK